MCRRSWNRIGVQNATDDLYCIHGFRHAWLYLHGPIRAVPNLIIEGQSSHPCSIDYVSRAPPLLSGFAPFWHDCLCCYRAIAAAPANVRSTHACPPGCRVFGRPGPSSPSSSPPGPFHVHSLGCRVVHFAPSLHARALSRLIWSSCFAGCLLVRAVSAHSGVA